MDKVWQLHSKQDLAHIGRTKKEPHTFDIKEQKIIKKRAPGRRKDHEKSRPCVINNWSICTRPKKTSYGSCGKKVASTFYTKHPLTQEPTSL